MKKTGDAKFDILKLALSLIVVLFHADPNCVYQAPLHPWIRVVVPLFFLMLSYFLFQKVHAARSREEAKGIIKRFLLHMLLLYGFWFVLLIPMTFENGSAGFLEHALKRLFLGSTYTASWFMSASAFGVLLIFALSRKLSNRVLLVLTVPVFIFVVGWTCYLPLFPEGSAILRFYELYYRVLSNPHHSFPAALVWIVVGKCFAEQEFDFRKPHYPILLVVSAVLLYFEWRFLVRTTGIYADENALLILPFCTALFALFLRIPSIELKNSHYLRRCSTYIYVMHGTLLVPISRLVAAMTGTADPLVVFFMDGTFCIAVYALAQTYMNRRRGSKLATILKYSY